MIGVMACNPISNTYAMIGDAHTAAAFFLVWGLVFLARWSKSFSPSSAFLAGLLLGFIPTLRYPETLFGLGIALFILFHLKNNRKAWSSAAVAIIGATIPIACLMVHNQIAFGAVWKTAYSLTDEQVGFSLDYFSKNISFYLKNILLYGAGLLWIFGIAGLIILCVNRKTRIQGILFIVLVFPITLLYVSYYFMFNSHPFATMRFLLPTFYIYSIAGILGLKIVGNRWKKPATVMTVTLLIVNTLWGAPQSLISMVIMKDANASLAAVKKVVSENVKPGSFVIAPKHIQQYLDYLGNWHLIDDTVIEGVPLVLRYIIRGKNSGVYRSRIDKVIMPLSQHIKRKIKMLPYMASISGDVSEEFINELDRWNSSDREIYWIGRVEWMKANVTSNYRMSVIKKIEPPKLLFWKVIAMFPTHSDQLNELKDRLWYWSFHADQIVVNPLGTIRLIQKDEGLELVKWTRAADS